MHFKLETTIHTANKILYWQGIIDPRGLSSDYEAIIKKIVEGNYVGLDLEKLSGHDVYSVRINQSDRLLFTTIMVKGKLYLMLLDEVLNHDYAKSRFLKPSVLKHYLELHGKAISEALLDGHFEACSMPPLSSEISSPPQALEYSRIDFYNQKFIELDDVQLGVINKAALPLIISGAPGSGKSCIALLIMSQYLISNPDKEDYPILYVSESENLVSGMKRSFKALPIAQGVDSKTVQFKSYQQLIKELVPDTAHMIFVGKDHCVAWLEGHIKQYKQQKRKTNPFSNAFFADIESLYQEFRIISGCKNLAAYQSLGQRQSLHNTPAERQWLFTAYGSYQRALADQKSIHVPFYPLALQNIFKRIVVDEAQDFSHLQLETLSLLASNRQICFCEDNRQSLSDNKSKIPFIRSLMHAWGLPDNHLNLNASYRCPSSVIDMANAVSGLKSIVTGDGQPLIVTPDDQTSQGTVTWFEALTDQQLSTFRQEALSPHFAIVTTRAYRDDAKILFKTPLVFTTDEIKGLEYKKIMAYGLLDEPLFKEADKLVGDKSSDFKTTTNRAKKDRGNEQFGPAFNGIYTAFTRATNTLYICQKKHHYLQNICGRLLAALPGDNKAEPLVTAPAVATDEHLADWFGEVKTQLGLGNEDVARSIYLEKLDKTPAEFEVIKALYVESSPDTEQSAALIPGPRKSQKITAVSKMPPRIQTSKKSRTLAADAIARSTSQQVESKNTELPIELRKLLKKINATTLFNFLKHKRAKELLFDYPVVNDACLFTTLFNSKAGLEALWYCMPRFIGLLSEGLTEEAICRSSPSTNGSPLYCFTATHEGQSVLKELLARNPEFAKLINCKALCKAVNSENEKFDKTSPLYWLAFDSDGQELLKILLVNNPDIAKSVSAEALCLPLDSSASTHLNASPLLWLSATLAGQEILKILLTANPELVKSISLKALTLSLDSAAGLSAKASSLNFLLSNPEGQEILDILRQGNAEIGEFLNSKENQSLPSKMGLFAQKEEPERVIESSDLQFN